MSDERNPNEPQARVEIGPDGRLVLHDPMAEEVIHALRLHQQPSAEELLALNAERVAYFVQRAVQRPEGPEAFVITVIDVDDALGTVLAELHMPGADWQPYRDLGERPVARGLASREGWRELLADLERVAPGQRAALDRVPATHIPVMVVARETVVVGAELLLPTESAAP